MWPMEKVIKSNKHRAINKDVGHGKNPKLLVRTTYRVLRRVFESDKGTAAAGSFLETSFTPPRTPRISGLKSHILKPKFLS